MPLFRKVMEADDRVFLQAVGNVAIAHQRENAERPRPEASGPPPPSGTLAVGTAVEGLYPSGRWYSATVAKVHQSGAAYTLDWDDGDSKHRKQPAANVRIARTPDIHEAAGRANSPAAVEAYIASAQDLDVINGSGQTPLHMAALFGREKIVQLLLTAGADVTLKWQGMTAPDMAKCNKHPKCVALLKPRIDALNAATKAKNATADPAAIDLWEAVEIGDTAAIRRVGDAGAAGLDVRNGDGETPLHKAVLYDHIEHQAEVVGALIAAGCDKDATRNGGWTALHLAAEHGHDECAELLIKAGADKTLKGVNGMTAFDIAKVCGNIAIRKMLQ